MRKGDIRVKEAKLEPSKCYRGSKDNEGQGLISSCGWSDAAIGTEGYLTFYEWDGEDETKMCRVYWSAPWGAYKNIFDILDWDPNASDNSIMKDEVQQDSTIGNVEIVCAKLA
ncbi:unnamed protein product [Clonostachys solani]|uniref:Uncharacterized protein n=1 Tax=Clonostachys solani TaxID=160281 RepID=A0A9N9ZIM7_9HYPO|nr:unnamed protein product [Clonostachys solani]